MKKFALLMYKMYCVIKICKIAHPGNVVESARILES